MVHETEFPHQLSDLQSLEASKAFWHYFMNILSYIAVKIYCNRDIDQVYSWIQTSFFYIS